MMNELNLRVLTLERRQEIFTNRENTILNLRRDDLFDDLEEHINNGDNVEFGPPTINERDLIQIAFHSLGGRGERLMLIWIRTYLEGGQVLFSQISETNFRATISFPQNT
jgi:hypothetical protein